MIDSIEKNYEAIVKEMRQLAATSPLAPGLPRLIAVSKGQPDDKVRALLDAGHKEFGENRLQEAKERWQPAVDYNKPELHFIGPLQTNKVAEVIDFFDCIHSLDRPKLADALAKARCALPCFIQVNTGEEPQKAGILPKEAPDFIRYCRDELKLNIIGLMCIPPLAVNPAPHFAFLRKLASEQGLERLSMGMSGDWRMALRMGATDIRVGSALFGERNT